MSLGVEAVTFTVVRGGVGRHGLGSAENVVPGVGQADWPSGLSAEVTVGHAARAASLGATAATAARRRHTTVEG